LTFPSWRQDKCSPSPGLGALAFRLLALSKIDRTFTPDPSMIVGSLVLDRSVINFPATGSRFALKPIPQRPMKSPPNRLIPQFQAPEARTLLKDPYGALNFDVFKSALVFHRTTQQRCARADQRLPCSLPAAQAACRSRLRGQDPTPALRRKRTELVAVEASLLSQ